MSFILLYFGIMHKDYCLTQKEKLSQNQHRVEKIVKLSILDVQQIQYIDNKMQNKSKKSPQVFTKNATKANKKRQKRCSKQQANLKQKKIPKLRLKTDEEIKIIQEFYHKYCNCWTTQQIRELSEKIGMKYGQVYKYLWDLRNRSKKKKNIDGCSVEDKASKSQNIVKQEQSEIEADQQQISFQIQQEQPILPTKTVLVQRITLEYPPNLKFANEFIILDHQKIPCQITNLLRFAGFSLFLEDNEDNQDMSQVDQQAVQDFSNDQYSQQRVCQPACHMEQKAEEKDEQMSDQINIIKQQQIYQESDDDHHTI